MDEPEFAGYPKNISSLIVYVSQASAALPFSSSGW